MKKSSLMILLAGLLLACLLCCSASAETSYTSGSYTYVVNEDGKTCTITGYSSSTNTITVPATLGGYTVTAIGESVFTRQTYLRTVNMGSTSITSIGYQAFYGVDTLQTVTFPSTLKSIGAWAFRNCTSLTAVSLPSSMESIGGYAFYNCDGLTSLTLPSGIETIGSYAFDDCDGLTSVSLPSLLSEIPASCFYGCDALQSVSFPPALTAIGNDAFMYCRALTELDLPSSLQTIGVSAFSVCSGLTEVAVPDNVTFIGASAFSSCSNLTSLKLSAALERFDATCISSCRTLTDLTIPDSNPHLSMTDGVMFSSDGTLCYYAPYLTAETYAVPEGTTAIGNDVFKNNSYLTAISLPSTLNTIGAKAFDDCSALAEINLPASLSSLGEYAFFGCDRLTGITVPEGVTELPRYCFSNCTALTEVNLPASLVSLGDSAFCYCPALTEVNLPASLVSLGDSAFCYCTALTEVNLPASLVSLGASAFYSCEKLTAINVPDSVASIGEAAFSYCTALTTIHLPDALTSLSDHLLQSCKSLTELDLPDGITSLNAKAFTGCSGITTLHLPAALSSFSASALSPMSISVLTIPADNTSFYTVDNVLFNADGTLTYYPEGLTAASYTVPEGTTAIGSDAFSGCTVLTGITLPETVTTIGYGAFSGCTGLLKMTIPGGVTTLDESVFSGCTSLVKVTLPQGLTSIGRSAFSNCRSLIQLSLPASVTEIGVETFMNCGSLESAALPDGITEIPAKAFYGCSALKNVTIPSTVTYIWYNAFMNCSALTSVVIPDSVRTIESEAFANCTSLESVTFPAGCYLYQYIFSGCTALKEIPPLSSLSRGLFANCTSLTTVVLQESVYSMQDAFSGCIGLQDVFILDSDLSLSSSVAYFPSTAVIHGYASSTAQTYASAKGHTFQVLDEYVISGGILHAYNGTATELTIPATVTEIGDHCFEGNIKILSVTIPGTVKTVGAYAFYNCDNLTTLVLEKGVTTLKAEAFSSCNNLVSVTLPDTIREMGDHVFYAAYSLQEIVVPEGITALPASCFSHAQKLESITLPSTLTAIGASAFNCCYALKTITIPEHVEKIDQEAFNYCKVLESIHMPDGVTAIGGNAFQGTPETLTVYCSAGSSTAAALGETGYCDTAYPGLKLQTLSDGIHASVTDPAREGYILPEGVTSLDEGMFGGCSALKYVVLPASVGAIADTAFDALPDAVYAPEGSFAANWAAERGVFTFDPALTPAILPLAEEIRLSNGGSVNVAGLFRVEAAYLMEDAAVVYASSDTGVAAVEGDVLTGVSAGEAVLTASLADAPAVTASIPLHVLVGVESITLPGQMTVVAGDSVQLTAEWAPEDAHAAFTWTVEDPAAAAIDGDVLTAGQTEAETTLTVTSWNGVSAQTALTVYVPVVTAVAFDGEQILCAAGEQIVLSCQVTDQHQIHENRLVTFSSSDDHVATVDSQGVVTVHAPGLAVITAEAESGVSDEIAIDARISLEEAVVSLDETPVIYNGTTQRPAVTVALGEAVLTEGADFLVSCDGDQINAGTVSLTIEGMGKYKGTLTADYTIQPADLDGAVIATDQAEYPYTGAQIVPVITVTMNGMTLTEQVDYTPKGYTSINAGTVNFTITGAGNYTGTASGSYIIVPKDLSGAVVTLAATSYTYTDNPILPGITSVVLDGETLGTSAYTLVGENNVMPGTATVHITGKGNYTGSVAKTFRILSMRTMAEPDTRENAEWAPYSTATLHEGVNHVYLDKDLKYGVSVSDGMTVYLDLNGYSIRCSYPVSVGGKLILMDSAGGGKLTTDGITTSGCGIHIYEGGEALMYGGTITGFASKESYTYHSGVYNEKGTFRMYGGTISNCSTGGSGGGIYCYYGSTSIHGGTITGNNASIEGGGVFSYRGYLDITGGSITGNYASRGGGVYFGKGYRYEPYAFNMSGGSVTGNTAYHGGAGVYVYYSDMTFSGGSVTGNSLTYEYGYGAGMGGSNGTISLTGSATVSGNKSSKGTADNIQGLFTTLTGEFTGSVAYNTSNSLSSAASAPIICRGDGELTEADLSRIHIDNPSYVFYENDNGRLVLGCETYYLGLTNARLSTGERYGSFKPGTELIIEAVVPEGKIFTGWKDDNDKALPQMETTITFIMPLETTYVRAVLIDEFVVSDGVLTAYNGEDKAFVTLPAAVTAVNADVFADCTLLKTVIAPSALNAEGVTALFPEGVSVFFADDGVLTGYAGSETALVLPDVITDINAVLPDTIVSVTAPAAERVASLSAPSLTELTLTAAALAEDGAFTGCPALVSFSAPALTSLGSGAFEGCAALESFSAPLLTVLPDRAFASAASLTTIDLTAVTRIGASAFEGCGFDSILLPDNVTQIGDGAFDTHVLILSSVNAYAREWAANNGCVWEHDVHTEEVLAAVDATCTEDGLTEGLWCPECEKVFTPQETIPAFGHSTVIDAAREVTCTEDGLTEGCHCENCGEVFVPQETIPAPGHAEEIIEGFAPECTEPGLTDCIFCAVCGTTLQEATEIPAAGHTEEIAVEAVAPTCTEEGSTAEYRCGVCGELISASETVPATGHTPAVTSPAVAPTCTEPGLTEETGCSVCNEIISAAEAVPATGHTPEIDAAVAPDCLNEGLTEGSHCSVCGEVIVAQETVPAAGHTPAVIPGVPPTDHEGGISDGSYCTICGITLEEQQPLPANFTYDGNTIISYNGTSPIVQIPADATMLGDTAFKNNTTITSVTVGDNISIIGTQTFYGCTSLMDVYLPDSLSGIVSQTFFKVPGRIHASAGSATAIALSFRTFSFTTEDGLILRYKVTSASGTPYAVWVTGWCGTGDTLRIPEAIGDVTVKEIHEGAFANNTTLKEITIPSGVTIIEDGAFTGCSETLVIRSAADAYAREWANANQFAWMCDEHTVVIDGAVPPTCTEDGLTAGSHCEICGAVIVEVTVDPAMGHTEVADEAVPPTCTEDGLTAGSHCEICGAVIVEVTVEPATGHTEIADEAVPPTHATTGLTEGSHCSQCGAVIMEQQTIPVEEVVSVVLPASLLNIDEEAFAECVFECVILPEGCEMVGKLAFMNCKKLRFVEIPFTVTAIADDAFEGCEPTLIIVTDAGSYAQSYAENHHIRFILRQSGLPEQEQP